MQMVKNKIELLLLLILISGCTVTVGTSSSSSGSKTPSSTYHYVRKGENLFRISKYYYDAELVKDVNKGIEKIKKANNLKDESLSTGQKLYIPGTAKKQPSYALLPPDKISPVVTTTPEVKPETPVIEEVRPIIADKVFIWPVTGTIICKFGELDNQGIDIRVEPGTNVLAADSGTVVFAGITPKYQETIIIEHSSNAFTVYGHDIDTLIKQGDMVKKGDVIGKVKSGTTRIRYLHFEIRIDNIPVNPVLYLPEPS